MAYVTSPRGGLPVPAIGWDPTWTHTARAAAVAALVREPLTWQDCSGCWGQRWVLVDGAELLDRWPGEVESGRLYRLPCARCSGAGQILA